MTTPAIASDLDSRDIDTDLIGRFLGGDERAFRRLYARHTPRLTMTLLRLLGRVGPAQDVEDVVQDTWLAGCRAMHTYRGEAKFSTWLTTIGVRAVLAQLRRKSRDVDLVNDDVAAPDHYPRTDAALDVERALARLPDRDRVIVVLHDLEGLTHEHIGELLGIATGTSKATLSRARATLRTAFAQEKQS